MYTTRRSQLHINNGNDITSEFQKHFLVNSISWTFEYPFYEICNDASNSLISMCYGFLQQISGEFMIIVK